MLNDEVRTVEECYSCAGNATDLTVAAEQRGDADVLIASGMAPGMLGSALLRLHSEWDGAAKKRGAVLTETDARLLYGSLKSLPRVIATVGAWAEKRGYSEPYELAGAAVAYWLDQVCRRCHGRGAALIPGTRVLGAPCKSCGGAKVRRPPGGEPGRRALNMMDECVEKARLSIKKRLRNAMR